MNKINISDLGFKINDTSYAPECGVFDKFYSIMGTKSNLQFCTLLIDEHGDFYLYVFSPNIKEDDVNGFFNNHCRIYRNELSNGVITTSLRGIASTDFVHLPNTSPIDLVKVNLKGQIIKCILVDTAKDEIKGIRMIDLSNDALSQILTDWLTIEGSGIRPSEISKILEEKMYCYSSSDFIKRSTCVGRDKSSIVVHKLYT